MRDDDSGEYERPRKKGGMPAWGWVLIGVGALLVVCGGGAAAIFGGMAWYASNVVKRVEDDQEAKKKKALSREQFRDKVMGKTPDEVIALFGSPENTQDSGGGDALYWYYRELTVDPANGKLDWSIQVIFEKKRVARVNY